MLADASAIGPYPCAVVTDGTACTVMRRCGVAGVHADGRYSARGDRITTAVSLAR